MSKIVRHEFMGSWLIFWLFSISIIGIPMAILYLVNGTVRIEDEVEDPERYIQALRK